MISPTSNYPYSIDVIPQLVDFHTALASGISLDFAKLVAARFNFIVDFINKVQDTLDFETSDSDGTVTKIGVPFTLKVPVKHLLTSFYKNVYNQHKLPPTHALPFEIVVGFSDTNEDDYSFWPTTNNSNPALVYMSRSSLESLMGATNTITGQPQVSCSLGSVSSNAITPSGILLSSHAIYSSGTLVLRGMLINSQFPTLSTSLQSVWSGLEECTLNISIMGVA